MATARIVEQPGELPSMVLEAWRPLVGLGGLRVLSVWGRRRMQVLQQVEGAHLQEGAPPELRAGDPPGPGPVDGVEYPLDNLQEEDPQRSTRGSAGTCTGTSHQQRAPAAHQSGADF